MSEVKKSRKQLVGTYIHGFNFKLSILNRIFDFEKYLNMYAMNRLKYLIAISTFIFGGVLNSTGNSLLNRPSDREHLQHNQLARLVDHLNTVNKEWNKQLDVPSKLLEKLVRFKTEAERIQRHLELVEQILHKRRHNNLTSEQYKNRLQNLSTLIEYWQQGVFPLNITHPERQPVFIDHIGTACAVGHLMQSSGASSLADQISTEMNFAYVEELEYPALLKWAAQNGFTKDELAWIQPCYYTCMESTSNLEPTWMDIDQPGDVEAQEVHTVIELNLINPFNRIYMFGGDFQAVTSTSPSRAVVGFDYNTGDWINYGTAIQGTVYAIENHDNKIFIGGDFTIAGTNFQNLAHWDGTTWQGLQTGEMNGSIKTLRSYECALYIGGDFTEVNGVSNPNIIAYNGTTLTSIPANCASQLPSEPLHANNIINDFELFGDKLAIGGMFTSVGNNLSTPSGLAFWNNQWETPGVPTTGLTHVNDIVEAVNVFNDFALWIGGNHLYGYKESKFYQPFDTIFNNPYGLSTILPYVNEVIKLGEKGEYGERRLNVIIADSVYSFFGDHCEYRPNYELKINNGVVNAVFQGEILVGKFTGGDLITIDTYGPECPESFSANKIKHLQTLSFFPIELSNFEIHLKNKSMALLEWTTQSETNSSYFQVERRTDFEDEFQPIGVVSAAQESFSPMTYNFEDDLRTISGTHIYYRLKMIDIDGSFEYSEIQSIKMVDQLLNLEIFPNPTQDKVNISVKLSKEGNVQINVYDLFGQLKFSRDRLQTTNQVIEQLNLETLNSGLYLLEIIASGCKKTEKIQLIN